MCQKYRGKKHKLLPRYDEKCQYGILKVKTIRIKQKTVALYACSAP